MAELIAVTTSIPKDFRISLLTFDRIAWVGLSSFLFDDADRKDPALLADVRFLTERMLLITPNFFTSPNSAGPRATFKEIRRLLAQSPPSPADIVSHSSDGSIQITSLPLSSDMLARAYAIGIREDSRENAVPLVEEWSGAVDQPTTQADVVRIVLNRLPIPGDTHSLEDILAFRDEARSEGLIQALRVWINEMASGKLTPIEVSDKLEDLMFRYERTMKLEKMRRDASVVETIVTTTADVAQALVAFKWSEAAKRLFDVRYKQIDLMKAELTAPGREVAYIVKAREQFGK